MKEASFYRWITMQICLSRRSHLAALSGPCTTVYGWIRFKKGAIYRSHVYPVHRWIQSKREPCITAMCVAGFDSKGSYHSQVYTAAGLEWIRFQGSLRRVSMCHSREHHQQLGSPEHLPPRPPQPTAPRSAYSPTRPPVPKDSNTSSAQLVALASVSPPCPNHCQRLAIDEKPFSHHYFGGHAAEIRLDAPPPLPPPSPRRLSYNMRGRQPRQEKAKQHLSNRILQFLCKTIAPKIQENKKIGVMSRSRTGSGEKIEHTGPPNDR